MAAWLLLELAGIVLSFAGYAIPEIQQSKGNKIKDKLNRLGKEVYTKMQSNQRQLDDLYNAYINKSSSIINSMMLGAGFGPRMASLQKALADNESNYKSKKQELNSNLAKNSNAYNQVQTEIVNAGTSFSANQQAQKVADQIEQNITGGLVDTSREKQVTRPVPGSTSI